MAATGAYPQARSWRCVIRSDAIESVGKMRKIGLHAFDPGVRFVGYNLVEEADGAVVSYQYYQLDRGRREAWLRSNVCRTGEWEPALGPSGDHVKAIAYPKGARRIGGPWHIGRASSGTGNKIKLMRRWDGKHRGPLEDWSLPEDSTRESSPMEGSPREGSSSEGSPSKAPKTEVSTSEGSPRKVPPSKAPSCAVCNLEHYFRANIESRQALKEVANKM
jgi:hypothetical protein